MSAYKLTFKLKQHTPIIHFQHDQSGATVRASELKPKLDKFLKEKELKLKFGENGELDYKLKIVAEYSITDAQEINQRDPLYFGNMGEGIMKFFVMAKDNLVRVNFISFDGEVIKAIKNYFAEFLLKNNFGTRQSKGFGSFYIDESDVNNYKKPEEVLLDSFYLWFQKKGNVLDNIAVIYNLMKSGINFPDHPMIEYTDNQGRKRRRPDFYTKGSNQFYFKSYLFQFFLNQGIGNEKHFIKEEFFNPSVRISPDGYPKKYLRAVLGVAGGVEFKDGNRRGKIEYHSNGIDRFKSPILFKIVNDYVFLLPQKILQEMMGQEFHFRDNLSNKSIYTPANFDLNDFLRNYAQYFNSMDRTILAGKTGRLHEMVNATNGIEIKIHEVQNAK